MKELPKSYHDIHFKTYVNILTALPSERDEDLEPEEWSRLIYMTTLSILTETTPTEIENLRAAKVAEMIRCISFLDEPVKESKTDIRIKDINELTFDEFVTYQKLRLNQWENLEAILLLVVEDKTPEEIKNFSAFQAMQVFFCLNHSTKKFLNRSKYSLLMKASLQMTKRAFQYLKRKKRSRSKSFKTVGDG